MSCAHAPQSRLVSRAGRSSPTEPEALDNATFAA
jgi:hypothetical protein